MPNNKTAPLRLRSLALAVLLAHGASSWAQTPAAATPPTPPEPTLNIQRYQIDGDSPLTAEETRSLLAPFLGEQRTMGHIEGAARALERAMRERGFAFHRMFVPAQKPAGGEVRLQVLRFTLGTVEVTGNQHFSAENIRRSLTSLKEGEVPEVHVLGRDVSASNVNPAKRISVVFRESSKAGAVDAQVRVADTAPLSYFASLTANQAVSGNGPAQNVQRLSGGFQHANLWGRDHVATLSYTTDPGHISSVSLFGAFYQMPLYGTGMTLSASFTSSDINSGRVQQGAGVFDVSGSGQFIGIRLARALNRSSTLQQTLGIGLDERYFENSSTFNGAQILPDVGSRVLSLQYQFHDEPGWGSLSGNLDYAVNIGGGAGNSNANHAANGGNKNWDAWRFNLEAAIRSGDWLYSARLKGQFAGKALVSGEQIGLGGANSLRGFTDRVVSGDHGHQWNLEAMGPALGGWQIRPVLFVEGGQVHARASGQSESLMSAGAGLRLSHQGMQLALDLAQVLERNSAQASGRPLRLHLALSYRF